jgi:serine/threonine protein kinase
MAPEVIYGEGYSFSVDFWSCAICMYEFVCGGVPFGENEEDPMNVYLAIINRYKLFFIFIAMSLFLTFARIKSLKTLFYACLTRIY